MLANTETIAPKYLRYRNTRRATTHECQTNSSESLPAQKNDGYKTQNIARYRRTRGSSENAESQYAPPISPEARVPGEKSHAMPEPQMYALKPAPVMFESNEAKRPWEIKQHKHNTTASQSTRSESTIKSKEDVPTPPQLDPQKIADQLALQKLKDLMRLQAELDAAPPTPNFPLSPSPKKEKLIGLFSRRKYSKTSPPCTPYTPTSSMTKTSPESQRSQGLDSVNSTPQVDAPLSAVNAKERRVLIRFKESSINLPVTVDTKPADIIQAAANMMSQKVTLSCAVLLESYSNLGLERRIRRYECIRDVMNSWDRDTQNALLLEHTTSDNYDKELDTNLTRVEAPPEITFHLYHSQKAGKWNKRYVTLLPSGQIFIAKKLGAKSTDKDYANICHLSDFDIYTVSSPHNWASLSPPKKICYAIKSQQKTTVFLSGENFVHYFSTEDDTTGEKFHSAVQKWRSWFIINRKGDGYQGFKDIKAMATKSASYGMNSAKASAEESSPGVSSFQPLLQMNNSDVRDVEDEYHSRHEDSDDRPLQTSLHQRNPRRHPPLSYKAPGPTDTDGEFLSSSLLGRTYSERKREQEASASISSNAGLKRAGSCPTNIDGPIEPSYKGPNQRSLLDFTPIFKGPPQWDRRGKGQVIRPIDGGPLIEAATSPVLPGDDIPRFNSMLRREDAKSIREKCRTTPASEGPFVKGGLISGGDGGAARRAASLKNRNYN